MCKIEDIKIASVNIAGDEIEKKICVWCGTQFHIAEDLTTLSDNVEKVIVSPCKCYQCEEDTEL